MEMIIATGVIVDQPTAMGSIYPRNTVERAIKEFNIRAQNTKIFGTVLDRMHIEKNEPVTHRSRSLFINDSGMVCAVVDIIDDQLKEKINNGLVKLVGRPVLSVPTEELDTKPLRITTIYRIMRVQLECSNVDESERSQIKDQKGGSN